MSAQEIRVTFNSDATTAKALAEHMSIAALALVEPTTENAGELFRIGAEAVVVAAEIERTRKATA